MANAAPQNLTAQASKAEAIRRAENRIAMLEQHLGLPGVSALTSAGLAKKIADEKNRLLDLKYGVGKPVPAAAARKVA